MIAFVQNVGAQEYFSSASDYARLYVGALETQYPKSFWYDVPYYKGTTDMYDGRISYYGVVYDHVLLRFDQLKQRVVVVSPVKQYYCLPEQEHIDWFEMDGHRYVHDPEDSTRYSSILCDGSTNGIQLYHCVWKENSRDKKVDEKKYLKGLATKDHYTIITPDGGMYHVKRAKDVAELFPEQKKQIRQFAKQNRLSFSKREREKSLVRLVEGVEGVREVNEVRDISNHKLQTLNFKFQTSNVQIQTSDLITGIPVLDSDSLAMVGSANTKVYVVPGVKKARASIADDQELAEIVVVGGRPSAVNNMMMGSEKFKPQLLKNIPSALVSLIL
jgi:hypothetical protein